MKNNPFRFLRRSAAKNRLAIFLLTAAAALCCVRPVAAQLSARYEPDVARYERESRQSPPKPNATFFVGSSTFTRWKTIPTDFAEWNGVNRAFGGSQISDWLAAADRLVIPYRPARIVFWCGGNDIVRGKPPEAVFRDFESFLAKVRAENPTLAVHYCLLPRTPKNPECWDKNDAVSEMIIERAAVDPNLYAVDYRGALCDENGVTRSEFYEKDGGHLNADGQKILMEYIKDSIRKETAADRKGSVIRR